MILSVFPWGSESHYHYLWFNDGVLFLRQAQGEQRDSDPTMQPGVMKK